MNRFEQELMDYINEIFRNEIDQGVVTFRPTSDENGQSFRIQEMDSGEFIRESVKIMMGWKVEIRRTRERLRDVTIVIESPDPDIMSEADDYRLVLRAMAQRAKDILSNPPFEEHICQGSIRPAFEAEYVEFIPRDRVEQTR